MVRIISVASGKGGVGKTTITINLAATLAKYFRKKVLVVDANFTTPHLGLFLGIFYPKSNLNEVLRGESLITDAIHNYMVGMDLLPLALSIRELQNVNVSKFPEVINEVKDKYDFVFIDSAPGLGREALLSLTSSNEILYVSDPLLVSITDILRTREVVAELGKKEIGIIINMVRKKNYEMKVNEIENLVNLKVLGLIPYDEKFLSSQFHKLSIVDIYPKSNLTKIFIKIAEEITQEKISREISFWKRFFGIFFR